MKLKLLQKQAELQKSMATLLQKQLELNEQITLHRGALQYSEQLLKELDSEECVDCSNS